MTKGIIVAAAAFLFALTVGILTANLAESGNDRASNPTIRTLALHCTALHCKTRSAILKFESYQAALSSL